MRTRISTLLIAYLLPFTVFSQLTSVPVSIPCLKTEGTGEIKVTPDWTIVNLGITAKSMQFNNTVLELNKKAAALEKEIISAGFNKGDLKTTGYMVNKNMLYPNGTAVDSGFIGSQTFVLEFPNEQTRLIKLVKSLSESKLGITFNFSFILSEKKLIEIREELIKRAVADAHSKAKVLSQSAGVSLKKIHNIEYYKQDYSPRPFAAEAARVPHANNLPFTGFNVNDLELTDKVTVIWEIEQ